MATTENFYTGDGSTVLFSFTFPYLDPADVRITLDGAPTTDFSLANSTTVEFASPPAAGASIRIYRFTDTATIEATFYPGSAIRSQDLNKNFTQIAYKTQETGAYSVQDIGNITLSANYTFNYSPSGPTPSANSHLATKGYVDSVAFDQGLLTPGDKGDVTVNSATSWTLRDSAVTTPKIADGAVVPAKLSPEYVAAQAVRSYFLSSF